jgi:selenocysteine-specific elongation factor
MSAAAKIRPLVIGTAGHIDHGKTALVRGLTGIDTDRLPEEKQRGISIDLGFAYLEPRPGLLLSFVDVPGHERFVKNMLAGATGIDAVLFVVAADEGLMPQSREHFEIVRLLGLRTVLGVITKCDLVDREMIDIVRLELEEYLAKGLGAAPPLFEASARSGAGLEEIRRALAELAEHLPERPATGVPRLSVDRRFVLQGHGTVVTGTQVSGRFAAGEAVEIQPSGLKARIRELQSHGHSVEATGPGQRVAMKLHGVGTDQIARGDVISAPGALEAGFVLNARVELLGDAPLVLEHRTRLRVHLGAAEVLARAEPLESEALEPGSSGYVQLRLEKSAAAVGGQRLVLRRYSPAFTIGGGVVLEFPAPKASSGDALTLEVLRRIETGRPEEIAAALVLRRGEAGLSLSELRRELERRGLAEPEPLRFAGLVEMAGERLQRAEVFAAHRAELLEALAAYHRDHPLEAGARPERLRVGILERLEAEPFDTLLRTLERSQELVAEQDRLRLPDFAPILHESARSQLEALVAALDARGPLEEAALLEQLKSVGPRLRALAQYLVDQGALLRMEGGLYLGRRAAARVLESCRAELESAEGLGVGQLRDKTGWSRKFCIPFLELTDGLKLTRRRGDVRFAGPGLSSWKDGCR